MENICIECKENRKILARGLCRTCYQGKRKNNEINTAIKKNKITIDMLNNCAYMEIYNREHEVKCVAIIDIDDIEKISNIHWNTNSKGYIFGKVDGKMTRLHHFVLNFKWDGNQQNTIDHINRNILDNRKENLRICNMTEQNRNRNIGSKLGKFISLNDCGNYKVMIYTKNKEQIYLGTFKNLEEAIKIRNIFLKENDNLCYQLQE